MDWFGQDVREDEKRFIEGGNYFMVPPHLSHLVAVGSSHALPGEGEVLELVAAEIPLGCRDDWHEQVDVCQARLQALVKVEGSLYLEETVGFEDDIPKVFNS